jgi:ABC-type Na+ efflux pump permease subunit
MNWRVIWHIALKDWKEIRQNRLAWMPTLIGPVIFGVILPLILLGTVSLPGISATGGDVESMIAMIAPALRDQIAGLDPDQTLVVLMLGYFFAPLFLIVPLIVASVFGADSIVGEKERKTLEALLYTPASDRELYLAKLLSSVAPAILLSWGSFLLYTVVVNVAGAKVMGGVWFPLPHWIPLILWVSPAVATLGMSVIVLISSRVNTFTEAQQTSGLLALPIIMLVIGQAVGVIYLSVGLVVALGVVVWLLDAGLIWLGVKQFSRSALMARI